MLARSIRLRREPSEDGPPQLTMSPSAQIFRANVSACTYFWGFVAVGSTLFWVMFYLI